MFSTRRQILILVSIVLASILMFSLILGGFEGGSTSSADPLSEVDSILSDSLPSDSVESSEDAPTSTEDVFNSFLADMSEMDSLNDRADSLVNEDGE